MRIEYANANIKKICKNPSRYSSFPKEIILKLETTLTIISAMTSCQDFFKPVHKGYRFEKLTNTHGLMSIRLNNRYRMVFRDYDACDKDKKFIEIVSIEILEVSNHYGD